MEDREEAARDEVVDAPLVAREAGELVRLVGRDDRVVVADLGVVDRARRRQHLQPRDAGRGLLVDRVGGSDPRDDARERRHEIGRDVARARPRVGQHLVALVAALRRGERALGGEAEALVGLALERREVVQERRLLDERLALDRLDDRVGAVRRARRSARPPRPSSGGSTSPAGACRRSARSRRCRTAPAPASSPRARTRRSRGRDGRSARASASARGRARPASAASRCRVVAARVAFMPISQSDSERERAASSSGRSSASSRRLSKASRIAPFVMDENQARRRASRPSPSAGSA